MFGKKKEPKIVKYSDMQSIQKAKHASQQLTQAVDRNLKIVEKMDKKTYLKYYIGVLEKQIKEATKILEQKKRELRNIR